MLDRYDARSRLLTRRSRNGGRPFLDGLDSPIIDLGHSSVTALPENGLERSIVRINRCREFDGTANGHRGVWLVKTDGFHRNHLRFFFLVLLLTGHTKQKCKTAS